MPITRNKKTQIIDSLNSILTKDKTMVFVSFKGVDANTQVSMRKHLTGQNIGFRVVKRTLLEKSLGSKDLQGEMPALSGEIAVAYSEDELASPREINTYVKKYKNVFDIKGGVFGGKFQTREEMLAIANIPSRETLLSQIAFLLKSPMQRLAIAVSEVAKQK